MWNSPCLRLPSRLGTVLVDLSGSFPLLASCVFVFTYMFLWDTSLFYDFRKVKQISYVILKTKPTTGTKSCLAWSITLLVITYSWPLSHCSYFCSCTLSHGALGCVVLFSTTSIIFTDHHGLDYCRYFWKWKLIYCYVN